MASHALEAVVQFLDLASYASRGQDEPLQWKAERAACGQFDGTRVVGSIRAASACATPWQGGAKRRRARARPRGLKERKWPRCFALSSRATAAFSSMKAFAREAQGQVGQGHAEGILQRHAGRRRAPHRRQPVGSSGDATALSHNPGTAWPLRDLSVLYSNLPSLSKM